MVRTVAFTDKLVLEFSLKKLTTTFDSEHKGKNALNAVLGKINTLYLPFKTNIHKSIGKDWNEDLKTKKRTKYIKLGQMDTQAIGIGDKIELKTINGPEGSQNKGIVLELRKNGTLCDFGLKYSYAIPFSAIKSLYKKIDSPEIGKEKRKTKKQHITLSIQ